MALEEDKVEKREEALTKTFFNLGFFFRATKITMLLGKEAWRLSMQYTCFVSADKKLDF